MHKTKGLSGCTSRMSALSFLLLSSGSLLTTISSEGSLLASSWSWLKMWSKMWSTYHSNQNRRKLGFSWPNSKLRLCQWILASSSNALRQRLCTKIRKEKREKHYILRTLSPKMSSSLKKPFRVLFLPGKCSHLYSKSLIIQLRGCLQTFSQQIYFVVQPGKECYPMSPRTIAIPESNFRKEASSAGWRIGQTWLHDLDCYVVFLKCLSQGALA